MCTPSDCSELLEKYALCKDGAAVVEAQQSWLEAEQSRKKEEGTLHMHTTQHTVSYT